MLVGPVVVRGRYFSMAERRRLVVVVSSARGSRLVVFSTRFKTRYIPAASKKMHARFCDKCDKHAHRFVHVYVYELNLHDNSAMHTSNGLQRTFDTYCALLAFFMAVAEPCRFRRCATKAHRSTHESSMRLP